MNFNKIFRIVICLVLVCALVVNVSPIKAQASITWSAVLIPVGIFVISCLYGIGVMGVQDNMDAFNGVADAARTALDGAGYIVDGMVTVYQLSNGLYYAKQEILDFLHNWSFDYGAVSTGVHSIPANTAFTSINGTTITCGSPLSAYTFQYKNSSGYYQTYQVFYTVYNSTIYNDGVAMSCTVYNDLAGGPRAAFLYNPNNFGATIPGTFSSQSDAFKSIYPDLYAGNLDVVASDGLSLGHIATPDVGLVSGYPNWAPTAVSIDGAETRLFPLGLGQTVEETQGFTQEQIWAGESTYVQDEVQDSTQVSGELTLQGMQSLVLDQTAQLGIWLGEVITGVTSIPGQILDGLGQILTDVLSYLFVPEQEFVQAKVQALTQEFAFASSIVSSAKAISTGLSGISTEPPIIYIDLGASRGSYYLGGRTVFMDLTWYSEYKATVDALISAFLWICFIWRMLLKLPGIIGGMPGDWVYGAAHSLGIDNHLPSRNAAYEVTRASNSEYIRKGPNK